MEGHLITMCVPTFYLSDTVSVVYLSFLGDEMKHVSCSTSFGEVLFVLRHIKWVEQKETTSFS